MQRTLKQVVQCSNHRALKVKSTKKRMWFGFAKHLPSSLCNLETRHAALRCLVPEQNIRLQLHASVRTVQFASVGVSRCFVCLAQPDSLLCPRLTQNVNTSNEVRYAIVRISSTFTKCLLLLTLTNCSFPSKNTKTDNRGLGMHAQAGWTRNEHSQNFVGENSWNAAI
jgi:hypothetical protein